VVVGFARRARDHPPDLAGRLRPLAGRHQLLRHAKAQLGVDPRRLRQLAARELAIVRGPRALVAQRVAGLLVYPAQLVELGAVAPIVNDRRIAVQPRSPRGKCRLDLVGRGPWVDHQHRVVIGVLDPLMLGGERSPCRHRTIAPQVRYFDIGERHHAGIGFAFEIDRHGAAGGVRYLTKPDIVEQDVEQGGARGLRPRRFARR
jgi:hypothetical protein